MNQYRVLISRSVLAIFGLICIQATAGAQDIARGTTVRERKTYTIPHDSLTRTHKAAIFQRHDPDAACAAALRLALLAGKAITAGCDHEACSADPCQTATRVPQRKKRTPEQP